ncbi:hypothetical protein GUJ93_ZPchr0012g20493 [Zizania palustris]|uniref:HECT-type E3 ubiquitin transferase n=1 Tax=Zizania palustris TaxID=103762 RepID=A0A8J6BQT1_ZIZPA|nr:hypothetical protein GUJ93_ZPchr0012g20493 [Zizania palustris]
MAAHRASFPLRLQQILSGSRAMSPAIKVESEPPAKVKSFIDHVISIPLHDITIPLSGFHWEFSKGNFHHWKPLFMHFDTYFKTHISSRKDLLLSDDMVKGDPLPKISVLQILRVMKIVLENCQNKTSFAGLEHFRFLLASSDPEIVVAALETLAALVKINPSKLHMNGKLISCGAINSYLLSLAQGWGSKEEGLGIYSCVVANERNQQEGLCLFPADMENKYDGTQHRLGSTLHFEYNLAPIQDPEQSSDQSKPSNLCVIHIPDLHLQEEDDLSILKQCIDKFNVPSEHRFSLFTRIRYAHTFNSTRTCRLYSRISLLAFIVLVQSSDAHDELASFFTNEPEYINELIRLVRSEEFVPGPIRALAMLALGAQLAAYASSHERARILSGSSIISAGGNRMVLLSVLQKAISSLGSLNDTSSALIVDALLQFFLLHVLSSSSSGTTVRGSGMVPPLLPLLQDIDPSHMHLVCLAVKTLQKLMEYSSPAVSLFKDLGGVELLSQRLHVEVQRVIGADSHYLMVTSDALKSEEFHLYSQKRLIKALLKALGSATYSPANPARSQSSNDNSLPISLSLIFQNVDKFGGGIYFSAVTVMSEIIHKDPTCFLALKELGLPDVFLSSVTAGVMPSCKALVCVPNGLGAICLNNQGLEAVRETSALRFLVDTFTSRKYLIAMNEGVVLLANAVEELLRHVQSLRSTGVDIIIEIINKLSSHQEDKINEATSSEERTEMETDVEGCDLVSAMDSSVDVTNDEQFSHLSIFHVMVLVHRTMENSETCRLFVEKGGLQALLTLLLRPSITRSSGGMPIALHSTMVFKGFTQHHSTPLAHAFCSSLKEHLKNALQELDTVANSCEVAKLEKGVISSVFVVEFLLFLAASKDNRWMNALLTEFGDGSRDVLEDIGRVHREVLWQISLLEKKKVEPETSSSLANDSQQEAAVGDIDDRYTSFRQYLDPLLRRRGSGWNIESQVSDLINIYRDIGRGAGDSQRYSSSGSQGQPSSSSDASASTKSEDKKRSEHSSCCDMMRSLSYHINHLFMELGKTMLLTSRRENSPVNLSTPAVSVANDIAFIVLEHLNFEGHTTSSEREIAVSTKCRYLGKVVEFIDGILLDRPESCNPIMLNSFYCHGAIQAILTTFEATSELLFAINRPLSSLMETDSKTVKEDKDTDSSWIYGPLSSYGTILDHLVTSSFILSSSTRQLLEQPIFSGSNRFPQDGEKFMKLLQSKVLKTILPIWAHPQFPECNVELISSVTSIMRHVYSGVEVKNSSVNTGARLAVLPPDENAISLIVEMGFSRARAEEALRQVGTNSVEIATDWLFSHPEEPQEDDELARALAMSLGNSDTSAQEEDEKLNELELEEETVLLPPIDEVLSSCLSLLQTNETFAFPVRDMLLTISSQNDGQNRVKSTALSALFHVLALILHGDTAAREVASKAGLVKVALKLLCSWDLEPRQHKVNDVPNWVTSCFLSIDRMLQLDPKLPDVAELDVLKNDNSNTQTSVVLDDSKKRDSETSSSAGLLDLEDQKQLLKICCKCIQKQLPSATMHATLQLCTTLTKLHAAAISFLESGGLHALLSLPTSSLFSGFNSVASTIIRHILEDPHTLQQAMELEIRHSLVTAANRHANPRVTPRSFVQNLAFVVYRDPVIFMKAAQAVCQVEMVGDRPYVVLLKDREKEKNKEKEKEKPADKDRAAGAATKMTSGDLALVSPVGKQPELNTKNVKSHRKPPQSFVTVIEYLLDLVASFVPPPRAEEQAGSESGTALSADMDIDCSSVKDKGKGVAVTSEESKHAIQEATTSVAKSAFVLKLLTDVLLTYASSVQVVLRHDADLSSMRGSNQTGISSGGVFNHMLQHFLPHSTKQKKERKADGDWRYKLATRANQFLVASSIRSAEGRRRIFSEICSIFVDFTNSPTGCKSPILRLNAYVDLLNDILSARSPTGSSLSAESAVTFVEVGLVQYLSKTLQVIDLDHPDSAKTVTSIVKALEVVTKEHVHSADLNAKGEESSKIMSEQNNLDSSSNRFQALDTTSQPTEMVTDHREAFNAVQTSQGSDSLADDMDHDRDLDGGFARDGEDDFMHEIAEDGTANESTMEIRFEIPRNREDMAEDNDDSDEDMSADDGEEVDEDEDEDEDEENNNLEEDAHQMSHPDTDQDEREIDEDEFDEDLLEDDDDEEEDEGVILRLEEGINGINVFDHIEVFGGSSNLSGDTLRVMPLDIFGTRRQGRSTSIYNLLGRAGDHAVFDHPLLEEPSSVLHLPQQRQEENLVEMAFSERNHENSSSRLDAIFRSLRSGRSGHRLNMWLDDTPQRSASAGPAVPEGIEELLITQLRRPTPEQPDDQSTPAGGTQENDQSNHLLHGSETEAREEAPTEQNDNNENAITPATRSEVDGSDPAPPPNDALQRDLSGASEHATEMHYEHSDAVVRDVEAVSQASSGSGATLGESLRSLEVEIGSVEGHDEGDRHGASYRLPLGDLQAASRSRRPSGSVVPGSSRDISLESVSEVPQNQNQETDQNVNEGDQEHNRATDSDSIDPTFLEALPEDLRAEVLSSRQNQVTQTSNEQPQNDGDIDPEFLAALPPDIREEVLAQQRAQRLQQSHELEGQPVEMDAVSIIATFPSEIREEVLLTSPDTLLATLTPALVAEANMLRERFAHRYHNGSLFGMNSRSRRGESSRRGEIIGSSLDRNAGDSSRQPTSKPIETEGAPLVDKDALQALIRLLRVVQPLYKGQLQRLLLNLCAHRESRKSLVQILVDMLMLDLHGCSKKSIGTTEPPFRLYGCHANITYSRPQSSDGVPPLVSRRVLETLTYLARNHTNVAKHLLLLEFPCPPTCHAETPDQRRGKAVLAEGDSEQNAYSLVLLLTLLNQPLYMRSVAHLEQLLNLLEVVMLNAENEITQAKLEASSEKPSGPENAMQDAQDDANISGSSRSKSNDEDTSKTPTIDSERNLQRVLHSLPQAELRLLCSLLAHDGLSDNAYLLVAEVLKKIVALAPFFCCHFINELAHSMQNLMLCAMRELHLYEDSEKAFLSTSSANGTAILRVVQALSSLVTTLQEKKDPEHLADKDHSGAMSKISEINASLDELWLELSNCISKIESSSEYASNLNPAPANAATLTTGVAPPLPAGTQNILPYIESFFVTCEKLSHGQADALQEASTSDMEDASTSSGGPKSSGSHAYLDEKHNAFVKFSEKHRRLLNAFVRQNPGLLEKSFSLMLKIPRLIEFDNKRAYFRSKIKHQHDHHHSPVRISVRRAYILEDSYNQLRMRSPQDLKGRLTVHFQGEEGIDAGGLTREWYQQLSRVIFDKGALLFTTVGNDLTFQPNPNSVYQTEHLSYFKFVGRVVGKALFDGQLLDVHFTRSFYKHILGVKVTYHDIEAIDPAYYKNLKWMLENDITDVLDLTFSMDADEEKRILYEKTEVTDCELIPGGRTIKVTEENKHEYVSRVAEHRLTTAIRPQINAFMEGFIELIARELISIFNDKELELLISGLPDIDLDDLKANTEYSGYSIASPVIQWFWEIVQGFSKEDKARFLQFVTGTSKVPLEGFSALQGISGPQRFQIHKAYGSTNHLPSAHTCFNQLDLPEYTSKEQLQERLLLAIHEANEGFGFG